MVPARPAAAARKRAATPRPSPLRNMTPPSPALFMTTPDAARACVNLISVKLLFSIEEPGPGLRLQRLYDRVAAGFGLDPARVQVSRRKLTGGHIEYGPPHRITISAHLSEAE